MSIISTRELEVTQVIDYLDGPTLFIAQDAAESRYICALLRSLETHSEYLCTLVGTGRLNSFLAGNLDLREAVLSAPLKQYFLLKTTEEDEVLMAYPTSLEDHDPALLPAKDYFVPLVFDDQDERLQNRALLDASLDVASAKKEHVLSAYVLADFLKIIQDFIKFCYKKKLSGVHDATQKKSLSSAHYSTNEVYATCGGSFTVKMRSEAAADVGILINYVPMEMAFDKAEEILESTADIEKTLDILRANKGHLVGSYKRLLAFLIENAGSLNMKWRKPSDRSNPKRFSITLDDAARIQSALAKEQELEDEFITLIGTVIHVHTDSKTWTLRTMDGEDHHGSIQPDKKITLDGITVKTVSYKFQCKEEISIDALGREKKKLLLYDHSLSEQ